VSRRSGTTVAAMPSRDPAVVVRPATREDYAPGARLLADALGFSAREAVPGWQMLTAARRGGVALAAWREAELAGWSYAFPAIDAGRRPYLFSCGLAVRADMRSRGVGRALKEAQRAAALERGYDLIAWTAEPLSSRALYLYLTILGARITGYAAGLYEDVREGGGLPQDDVEIEWRLHARAPERHAVTGAELTRTAAIEDGPRRLMAVVDEHREGPVSVELPWDLERLRRDHPAEALRWRAGVRSTLTRLLDGGYRGVEVALDRAESRSFLLLTPP
jgi:predicted GNAT superfamily acetyltransferase